MKKYLLIGMALFLVVSMGFDAAAQNYTWRLGTINVPGSLTGEMLTLFAQKVEEKTDGQMRIRIGFGSAFGGLRDLVPAVSSGSVEMMLSAQNWWDTIDINRQIHIFPYTFESWEHMEKYVQSPLFQDEVENLKGADLQLIFPDPQNPVLWKRGPYRVMVSKKPIYTASDLEGLRLRLYESELANRVWTHMGTRNTIIAWDEAYLALQQGMVEAITSPLNMLYDMKFHEVAPYITNINEFLQYEAIVANKTKWDALPVHIREAIVESFAEVAAISNAILEERVEEDLQKMLEDGAVYIRTSTQTFSDKIAPLAKELESEGWWREGLFHDIQQLK